MATSTDDRPTIEERYRAAINTSSLVVDPRSARSPSDVVGAFGLADRQLTEGFVRTGPDGEGYPIRPEPMAVALARLFAGDDKAAPVIVAVLAQLAFDQSWKIRVKISREDARDMAALCLRWYRDGACPACGGHGYDLIPGSPTLSDRACKPCAGSGKVILEDAVDPDKDQRGRRELVRWMLAQMERASSVAGVAAMRTIAPRLEL